MNKFRLFFILLITSLLLFSCNKNTVDDIVPVPIKDYAEQYEADKKAIDSYLDNHYIVKTIVNGEVDVTFAKIAADDKTSISIRKNTEFPLQVLKLKNDTKTFDKDGKLVNDFEYNVNYININEGDGVQPKTIDSTFTAYRGSTLDNNVFDENSNYVWSTYPSLESSFISGYRQFVSQLKTAKRTINPDGTATYGTSGAGVVFLPSGLGYYQGASAKIPAYSPLIFRIRIKTLRERDHDGDGILSKFEDFIDVLTGNYKGDYFGLDTDGDNIPNFGDTDDDGDGILTKLETKKDTNGKYADCDGDGIPDYLDKDICK